MHFRTSKDQINYKRSLDSRTRDEDEDEIGRVYQDTLETFISPFLSSEASTVIFIEGS